MQNNRRYLARPQEEYADQYAPMAAPFAGYDANDYYEPYTEATENHSSSSMGHVVDDIDNYDDFDDLYLDDPSVPYAAPAAPPPRPTAPISSYAPKINMNREVTASRPFGQLVSNNAAGRAPVPHQHPQAYSSENDPSPHTFLNDPNFRPPSQRPRSRGIAPVARPVVANPPTAHGIRLRLVSELPDMFRGLFKFGCFNAIQSKCFDTIFGSNENAVISAPTGSGKTVLFELAMIRLFTTNNKSGSNKCIYIAPTKALCSERFRDWEAKFEPLGIKCREMTGDTVTIGKEAWGDARDANIIVTTAEKWDSLTRNWRDHGKILAQIQLLLIDEVHVLNETRGSTLEVVVSRMKTRGFSVRFITVSATVPNVHDVASWIGSKNGHGSAEVFQFGDEFRPCKLERHVYGFPLPRGQNEYMFSKSLDKRVFELLQQHSANKPVLVFVATRSGVWATAEQLAEDYERFANGKRAPPWPRPKSCAFSSPSRLQACLFIFSINKSFADKRLEKLAAAGIGAHNAGLALEDKRAIEELFLNKSLRVVVCTSTLAVGVNLPAHLVVIKGVKMFQAGDGWKEYSDLDLLQMIGRAGRPQFDDSGTAIIMCENELTVKYENFTHGTTILESSLHLNLTEHVNSEIGLGNITDIPSARLWLERSFMFRRFEDNPSRYVGSAEGAREKGVDGMLVRCIEDLKKAELVQDGERPGELVATEYGDIMSKFYIRKSTMALILALPEKPILRELVEMVSKAEEISEMKMRSGEKAVYRKLNDHLDIRYKLAKVDTTSDKLFLLIQSTLSAINLNSADYKTTDSQPHAEANMIYRHLTRITRAMVEVAMVKQNGALAKHGLELLRMFSARSWDDRPTMLAQLQSVGVKHMRSLAAAGIANFDQLRQRRAFEIDEILGRTTTSIGTTVLKSLAELPRYYLKISELSTTSSGGAEPVVVKLHVQCGLVLEKGQKLRARNGPGYDATSVLCVTSDLDFIDYRRIPTLALKEERDFTVTATLAKPSQSVCVYISSEYIAGVSVSATYRPKVKSEEFPVMDTRPRPDTTMEMDLAGLENDAEFWNPTLDSDSDEVPVIKVKDLTKPQPQSRPRPSSPAPSKPRAKAKTKAPAPAQTRPAEKLPNGKYSCNHSCKDKNACRHLCCREGLDKPPPPPKPRATAKKSDAPVEKPRAPAGKAAASESSTSKAPPAKPKPKPKAKPTKPPAANRSLDANIAQLNTLHEHAGVASNLNIARDHRITLSNQPSDTGPTKRTPKPGFDVKFAVLEDSSASALDIEVDELDSSGEDELPDASGLLDAASKGKRPSKRKQTSTSAAAMKAPAAPGSQSSTTYDNSEIDSLIRAMPGDEVIDLSGSTQEDEAEDAMALDPLPEYPHHLSSPRPLAKRKQGVASSDSPLPASKRTRYTLPSDSPSLAQKPARQTIPLFAPASSDERDRLPSPPPAPILHPPPQPLFLPSSPAQDDRKYDEDEEEGFVLDESLFNIVDAPPRAPAAPQPAAMRALPPPKPSRPSVDTIRRELEEGFYARQRVLAEERAAAAATSTARPPVQVPAPPVPAPVPSSAPEDSKEEEDDPLADFEDWLATSGQVVLN